jgi:predicted nucleic acid-binding protein
VVILVDSSAWIEFLRGTGSAVARRVDAMLDDDSIAVCDPIRMELLAGARSDRDATRLRALLARGTEVPCDTTHFEEAALAYRACRRQGETVRNLVDCLIAAVAVAADVPVLHADADFDVLARHTGLRIA